MSDQQDGPFLEQHGDAVRIRVKAVPGAASDQIAGLVGNRLKIRIGAPPEGGKANKAICRVLAQAIGVKPRQVSIEQGLASPEKTVLVTDVSFTAVQSALH